MAWSPKENKFAVGSGARCISICYFEEDKDWWVSKHLKKPIRGTILGLKWHWNNVLLCASSADYKARVFSAFVKGVDEKPEPSVWGDKLPFNTLCLDYAGNGWIHDISFSPSGNNAAWVSHDCTLTICENGNSYQVVKSNSLPFLALFWVNENSIIVAGHDCVPFVFTKKGLCF